MTDYLGADVVHRRGRAPRPTATCSSTSPAAKLKLQGGSPVALNWAIDSVRKGGTVSVMGAYGPMFSAVKFGDAMNKGLTLRMNQCPVKRQWPRLFEHIRNGYLKPSDIVTHRIPLEDIAEGYHMFSAKLDGCIKPLDRARTPEHDRGATAMAYTADKPRTSPSPATSCGPASPAGASTSTRRTGRRCPKERFDPEHRRALGLPGAAAGEAAARDGRSSTRSSPRCSAPRSPPRGALRRDPPVRLRAVQRGPRRALAAADRRRPGRRDREPPARRSLTAQPDNPITETGIKSEFTHHGLAARTGTTTGRPQPRVDRPGLRRRTVGGHRVRRDERGSCGWRVGSGASAEPVPNRWSAVEEFVEHRGEPAGVVGGEAQGATGGPSTSRVTSVDFSGRRTSSGSQRPQIRTAPDPEPLHEQAQRVGRCSRGCRAAG